MGIPVLPPDINESFEGFSVVKGKNPSEKDSIRFGLTTIKNFGEGIGTAIITERKAGGKFTSLSDFLTRITDKNLNKKSLESLIKVGALNSLAEEHSQNITDGNYRATLLHNLERLLTFHKEEQKKETDQDSLFSLLSGDSHVAELELEPLPGTRLENDTRANNLMWEKELLGLYISGHPLDNFASRLEKLAGIKMVKATARERQPIVLAGIIEEMRDTMTKKGEKMLFMKLTDMDDSIDTVVFPKIFEEFQDILIAENCIVVKGTFSTRNGEKSVLIDKVKMME